MTDRSRRAVLMLALLAGPAVLLTAHASWTVLTWAAATTLGTLLRVPSTGGRGVALAPGVLLAACRVFGDWQPLALVWVLAVAGFVVLAARVPRTERSGGDLLTGLVVVAVFSAVARSFEVRDVTGPIAAVVALSAAGIAWYLARTLYGAASGATAVDGSFRYDWLSGLDDWPAAVTVLAPAALFGLARPDMGWAWSAAMAAMLHAFGYVTAVRRRRIERTYDQTILALSQVAEVADLIEPGHVQATAAMAGAVARRFGMSPVLVHRIEHAALLHDVGAVAAAGVGSHGIGERELAAWGAEIVGAIPTLAPVARVIADQDRPYREVDGTSAPLAAGSRIVRACAAYQARIDAGRSPLDALQELFRGASHDFDPEIVNEMRRYLIERGVLAG